MVICKHCKAVIKYITSTATATTGATLYGDDEISLDNGDLNSCIETDEWRCPECDGILAYDEDEARELFKNVDKLKEIVVEKINKIKNEKI